MCRKGFLIKLNYQDAYYTVPRVNYTVSGFYLSIFFN